MIGWNRSALSIYSESMTAAEISDTLGMQPHSSADIGEPTRAGIAGRPLADPHLTHQRTRWSFEVGPLGAESGEGQGVDSLRALVDVFRDKANELASLRLGCETVIWWSASSDSSQGTFVVPSDVIVGLGLLGCELRGTVFLDEDDDEDD